MASPERHELVEVPTTATDLCYLPATEQRALLRCRALSARELLDACLDRIDAVNPAINAIVTLDPEGAMAQAQAADDARARARREEAAGAPTHCPQGHPYEDSWYGAWGGHRQVLRGSDRDAYESKAHLLQV